MNAKQKYDELSKEWSSYLRKNRNRRFYFDRLLERLLRKYDLSLDEYYREATRKQKVCE